MGISHLKFPKVLVIESEAQAREAVRALIRDTLIGLDTETDFLHGELVSFQYSNGHNAVFVPAEYLEIFRPALQDPKLKKVFHNAPYDLETFDRHGCPVAGFHADTLVMDWLRDENAYTRGLEVLTQRYFSVELASLTDLFGVIPKGKRTAVLPSIKLIYNNAQTRPAFINYSAKDPFYTYHSFIELKRDLKKDHLWEYYKAIEAPFTLTLWRMSRRGVQLDLELLRQIGNAVWYDQCRAKHLFMRAVGKEVNLNSPKQLTELFINDLKWEPLKHTAGSIKKSKENKNDPAFLVPSVDNEVLEAWADEGHRLAKILVEHRRANKSVSGFILPFFDKCDADGVIRSEFNQIGTVTGRLSSRTPNLQNVPAREEKDPHKIRRVFKARKGKKLVVADYGGIELRVMAHESRDEHMMAAFAPDSETEDLHSLTASQLWDDLSEVPLDEIKKKHADRRAKAKSINFLIQYGGQGGKAAKVIGCSDEEGQAFIERWLDFYTGVRDFMEACKARALRNGYVSTLAGRRRRIRDIKDKNFGIRSHAERQALNSPIQGGAADIIKVAMNSLDRDPEFMKLGWYIVLQVHDELVCEGPEANAEKALPIIVHHMEEAGRTLKMRVPLKAVAKIGDNWNAAK